MGTVFGWGQENCRHQTVKLGDLDKTEEMIERGTGNRGVAIALRARGAIWAW